MPKEIPALDAQTLALLKERRAQFAGTPTVLPELHRRLRVAAMEKTSLRAALRHTLERLLEPLAALSAPARLSYAGACAAVALALVLGLNQNRNGGERLLTLSQPAADAPAAVQYAFNDVSSLPVSLDQRIDQMTAGQPVSAPDINQDSAQHAAGAHYVLTSTPASYDSVVAF